MSEAIQCYKTKDGRTFTNKEDADIHEMFLLFVDCYYHDPILDKEAMGVPAENVYAWLQQNLEWIQKVMTNPQAVIEKKDPKLEKFLDLFTMFEKNIPVIFNGREYLFELNKKGHPVLRLK